MQKVDRGGAALIVFARLPQLNCVKTRLAAGVGPQAALELYEQMLLQTLRQASRCGGARCTVYYSNARDGQAMAQWLEAHQLLDSPDLGLRMQQALKDELETASKVLVIGSDVPSMTSEVLEQALAALGQHEMVLGPAVDGGFYLAGITRLVPAFLQGITWSTPDVYQHTTQQAQQLGYTVAPPDTLPRLHDIDNIQDLDEWTKQHSSSTHPLTALAQNI